jgi:hypothetical protein
MDYTPYFVANWQAQVDWASGLGGSLTVDLDPGYTTDIDWGTDWRLPKTQDLATGYNQTGSEMGHLYYVSLGNVAMGPLLYIDDFNHLLPDDYWSGTEYSPDSIAYLFNYDFGFQSTGPSWSFIHYYAMAVRAGDVSAVPIPSAVLLLSSGLAGLGILRRVGKRRESGFLVI